MQNYYSRNLLCQASNSGLMGLGFSFRYLIIGCNFFKIVHGDLAARNILLDAKGIVKISDFGLSKVKCENTFTSLFHYCPLGCSITHSRAPL